MPRPIYTFLLFLMLPFVPLKLLWRGIKQPAYRQHWRERFGFYSVPVARPVIWLHCVSVGETRAAVPLVNALLQQHPEYQILLTHTTPTGRDTSEQLFTDAVQRVYLPYDLPFAVNRFLRHFNPRVGLLMETELWFNLIAACQQKKVPLLLLNARLSEKSANGYARLGKLVKNGLSSLKGIAAQTEPDAKRLEMLGANSVLITGNVKFDVKPPKDTLQKGQQLRQLMGSGRTVFLAASTREGEEALILEAVKDLDLLTVIVPRHPQRFNEVAELLEKNNINYVRRTNLMTNIGLAAEINADTQTDPVIKHQKISVVLGDSMGELFTYYVACDFAFVGGSLLDFGGQNIIEPACLGKPVLIGKYTYNFAEIAKNAIRTGAAALVKDVPDLREKIHYLQQHPARREKMREAALRYSAASMGASERLMQLINRFLV